jgi:hypothetical protein
MTGLGPTTRGEIFLPVEAVTAGETCGDRNRPLIPKSMSIRPSKAAPSRMSSAATQACRPDAGSQAHLAQRTRGEETIGAHPADRLKARNDTQRDRHNGKQRHRH